MWQEILPGSSLVAWGTLEENLELRIKNKELVKKGRSGSCLQRTGIRAGEVLFWRELWF